MDFSRRGLLKLSGGASVGGLVLSAAKALGVAPSAVNSPPGLAVGGQVGQPLSPSIPNLNPMQALLREFNQARESTWISKKDCLDLDIRTLKSVSPAMQYHMQRVRDRHQSKISEKLNRLAYPEVLGQADDSCAAQPARGY